MSNLNLRSIRKRYGDTEVVHGVDLQVEHGEFLVFVGPSGCGKSTMLRMIAGLEEISEGDLFIGGTRVNDLPPAQRGTAMVFQNYALYPHMTVAENMGFALKMAGQGKAEIKAAVGRAAEILRIGHLLDRLPKALSGGERQRVAIGRAIVRKPKVFLFDEPLSNLDASLRVQMRLELTRLHRELGSTMIYVTHDQVEAMTMGDRIAVFNKGRIEQVGSPLELYDNPGNTFVAGFLGSPKMNFIPCTVGGIDQGMALLTYSNGANLSVPARQGMAIADTVTVGLRPEHIEIVTSTEGLPVVIDVCEHLGDSQIVYLKLAGMEQPIAAKIQGETHRHRPGDRCGLRAHPQHFRLFDTSGNAIRDLTAEVGHKEPAPFL